jgi:hypothetical protein
VNTPAIRLRLQGHGDLTAHRDGSFTLRLERPAGEWWYLALARAVREIPGAVIRHAGRRPMTWRGMEAHVVEFGFSAADETTANLVGRSSGVEV